MAGADAAARVVRGGGVIAYPTDTVWGLGGDARRPDVVARVRALKGRDGRPMLVLARDLAQVDAWAAGVPDALRRAAEVAGVTVLLPASEAAPPALVGPEGLVGARVATGWTAELLARLDGPLLSTSANRSGEPTPSRRADLAPAITRGVDLVADGPEPPGGAASTLVRADGRALVVVRAGAVTAEALAQRTRVEVREAG